MRIPAGVAAVIAILVLAACEQLPVGVSESLGVPTPVPVQVTESDKPDTPQPTGHEAQPQPASETQTHSAVQTTPTLAIAFTSEAPSGDTALEVIQTRIAEQEGRGPQPTPTPRPRVDVTGPETVAAPALGLMWQRRAAGMYSFEDAELYCRELASDGHADWRLPSIAELDQVVGCYQDAGLSRAGVLWSSTPHKVRGVMAYDLRASGIVHLNREMAQVICVRRLEGR
jgi:hypothetical protein